MPRFFSRAKAKRRWIKPLHDGEAGTNQPAIVGRVYLKEFEVIETQTIDQIVFQNGSTVAGTVRVGIYGPLVTHLFL